MYISFLSDREKLASSQLLKEVLVPTKKKQDKKELKI